MIYRGSTEIIAARNPFMIFDSSPRNAPCSFGLTMIDKKTNAASANNKSFTESLRTVGRGMSSSVVTRHAFCHTRLTATEATTAKTTLGILGFNVTILSISRYFNAES